MSIIKKSQLAWLFTPALALLPGTILAQGHEVKADTNTDTDTDYTVKTGDTLSKIALDKNTTVSDLATTNKIANKNLIIVGQKLKLKAAAPVADNTTYTVKSGDTLSQIAADNNMTTAQLAAANNLSNADLILVGQTLKLTAAATPAPATTATTTTQTNSAAATNTTTQKTTQAATTTSTSTSTATTTGSTTNYGTFKLSFYDPAALGSNMGYSGVAANLSVFPKGTHLKITLSNGTVWYRTVNDTGTFAYSNPHQLDVAMPSSQIPSAGILYATVEVLH
ncbi:cell wall-associated hydrolase [Lacticaseibacillus manihotivorans DSM 13343 = JCM 12514]|uniref:Cell wall-associated hydrolase n=1 Tax=Lacticaseibacillus manihotivorans DSM 13343 = JCM 12514 TaxID=1423769 RepID=A0A0R1QES0_9LACO|nr:LysM peptidoglycan-binding domain-containing protein [Lacticaseibacillus manihotivorans]KRL43081.1 cell wall-associated hydrolase [Lacticaseibacillus manihotivorans DSM 13343 = JCM 12514]